MPQQAGAGSVYVVIGAICVTFEADSVSPWFPHHTDNTDSFNPTADPFYLVFDIGAIHKASASIGPPMND